MTQVDGQSLRLRHMSAQDLGFVVEEHRIHFPDGFFARLGAAFLVEYYRSHLSSPAARTWIAELDGQPCGFLVGMTNPALHRRHLLHSRGLLRRGLLALLARPDLTLHFLRTRARRYARAMLKARRPMPGSPQRSASTRVAVLAHVAVRPHARSRGIGTGLIERFVQDAAAAGCTRITLVTDAGPEGASGYYTHRGWQPRGEHPTHDGKLLTTFDLVLVGPALTKVDAREARPAKRRPTKRRPTKRGPTKRGAP